MIETIKESMRNPKRVRDVLWVRMGGVIFGHKNYKKFVVLARGRTGSNMLVSMLNSHPSIYAEGEIFGKSNDKPPLETMNKLYHKYPYSIKAVGFKILYENPPRGKYGTGLDGSLVWDLISEIKGLHVIHLKRRNILRTLLSTKIAFATNEWVTRDRVSKLNIQNKQVNFTEDELLKGFEQTREWEKSYDQMFESKTIINIFYEDLVNNPGDEFRRVTDMLDLELSHPTTDLSRQNPEKMSNLITNYESLKNKFINTEWSIFFDD